MTDHEQFASEIAEEESRVERLMTAEEIFAAGFKLGLSKAGLTEDVDAAYKDWLLLRVDDRERRSISSAEYRDKYLTAELPF